MPSFQSGKVTVYENDNLVTRHYFIVENMHEAICVQVLNIMLVGMFVPSIIFTKLENKLLLKFGGDKGGKFVKFKFGVTIMNSPFLNSPDSFGVIRTLDTDDSYFNLKHGIFNMLEGTLNLLFYYDDYVQSIIMKTSEGDVINVIYAKKNVTSDIFSNISLLNEQSTNFNLTHRDNDIPVIVTKDDKREKYLWLVCENNIVSIMRVSGTSDKDFKIIWGHSLASHIPCEDLTTLSVSFMIIHALLRGDIEFLNPVVGV